MNGKNMFYDAKSIKQKKPEGYILPSGLYDLNKKINFQICNLHLS